LNDAVKCRLTFAGKVPPGFDLQAESINCSLAAPRDDRRF
jgi:hypothetical protein